MREAGALLICETTVEELVMDGKRCIGVRCDRKGGEVYADVVILADGVNSTLARKAGFHGELDPGNVALAVKEILFLPEEVIQQRFNIKGEEGVVIELMGTVTEGMVGTGFLYTNKDSLTIGVGCMLGDFKANPLRTTPYALLEKLKQHPSVAPLIEGGEMKEYTAHLIPEGGFHAVPPVSYTHLHKSYRPKGSLEPSYVLRALGLSDEVAPSSIRLPIGRFSTAEDIDAALRQVHGTVQRLRELSPLWDMHQAGIDLASIQ